MKFLCFILMLAPAVSAGTPDFERDVKPLLSRYCLQCHGETVKMGDLDLRTPSLMVKGGQKGAALVKGSAENSLLYRRIAEKSMPMTPKKLTDQEARVIKEWIDGGAPGSGAELAGDSKEAAHWAFSRLRQPLIPQVRDATWSRTPVDAFVLHELEKRNIVPAPAAERVTLLRRAFFSLVGIPPTPEQVAAFLNDKSPGAFERVVDNLLESPHYGERWARHWLDVVRYAESNGYERDGTKPSAWRYRDYVIDSFNRNKPFDRFLTEQLAGDEIEDSNAETQIATTFLRLGVWDDEPANELMDRYDQVDDALAVTSNAFLGLTIRCARCHDHKFEPFKQKEYYQLLSVFEPLKRPQKGRSDLDRPVGTEAELRAYQEAMKNADATIEPLQRLIANLKRGLLERLLAAREQPGTTQWQEPFETVLALRTSADRRTKEQKKLADAFELRLEQEMLALARPDEAEQIASWKKQIAEIEGGRPTAPPRAYIWYEDSPKAPPTHIFHRGDPEQPLGTVEPGVPAVLGDLGIGAPVPTARTTGRRLWLARWMTHPENPIVARVFVNRVWQWHFGEGLVASANDFGVMGQRPTHPELLDYLASEFVRSGWNIKKLQKLIVTSRAFALSSAWDDKAAAVDSEGALLWRWKPRRLEAETIRDSTLAVTGQLNPEMYGPSIYPQVPAAVLAAQSRPGENWGKSNDREASRRSIYVFAKRGVPVPELDLMDAPDTTVSCERRRVSTTGPQALTLLNGEFAQAQAKHLAERLRRETSDDPAAQIRRAYLLTLSRPPRPDELEKSLTFLTDQKLQIESDMRGKGAADSAGRALQDFSLVLLNTNEFFYLN